jgi:hypothetical protein
LRLQSAVHFSAPKIFSSAVHFFHDVPKSRFPSMQFSSKGFRTASGDTRRFLPIDFAHEIGDLVFPEMAVDENESFFGEVEIFGVGRVQGQVEGGDYTLPAHWFREKHGITGGYRQVATGTFNFRRHNGSGKQSLKGAQNPHPLSQEFSC